MCIYHSRIWASSYAFDTITLCHNCHFRGQISNAFNEINGNGSVYYAINKTNDLIIHCWNLNVMML